MSSKNHQAHQEVITDIIESTLHRTIQGWEQFATCQASSLKPHIPNFLWAVFRGPAYTSQAIHPTTFCICCASRYRCSVLCYLRCFPPLNLHGLASGMHQNEPEPSVQLQQQHPDSCGREVGSNQFGFGRGKGWRPMMSPADIKHIKKWPTRCKSHVSTFSNSLQFPAVPLREKKLGLENSRCCRWGRPRTDDWTCHVAIDWNSEFSDISNPNLFWMSNKSGIAKSMGAKLLKNEPHCLEYQILVPGILDQSEHCLL